LSTLCKLYCRQKRLLTMLPIYGVKIYPDLGCGHFSSLRNEHNFKPAEWTGAQLTCAALLPSCSSASAASLLLRSDSSSSCIGELHVSIQVCSESKGTEKGLTLTIAACFSSCTAVRAACILWLTSLCSVDAACQKRGMSRLDQLYCRRKQLLAVDARQMFESLP